MQSRALVLEFEKTKFDNPKVDGLMILKGSLEGIKSFNY